MRTDSKVELATTDLFSAKPACHLQWPGLQWVGVGPTSKLFCTGVFLPNFVMDPSLSLPAPLEEVVAI